MAEAGWHDDPRLVRLGFAAGAALRYGTNTFPPVVRALSDLQWREYLVGIMGRPFGELLDTVVELRAHCLQMGAEALALGRELLDG